MVSQPTQELPDPRTLVHAISRHVCHDRLKLLPTTLQQFAHLQLLAAKVRSEATRAMDAHLALSERLEREGVDEADWCRLGALSKAEGRALRKIMEEGEGQGEEKREDVMMELSLNIRLFHLALILRKADPNGPVTSLLQTYFPDLAPPPLASPKTLKQLQKWYDDIRSSRMCFIRAMTPEQAQRMAVKRRSAQAMLDMVRRALSQGTPRPTWAQLLPEETLSAEKILERYRRDMVGIAEDVLRDKEIIDAIFAQTGEDEDPDYMGPTGNQPASNKLGFATPGHGSAAGLGERQSQTDHYEPHDVSMLAGPSSCSLPKKQTISTASPTQLPKAVDGTDKANLEVRTPPPKSHQHSSTPTSRPTPTVPSATASPTFDASSSHNASPKASASRRPRRSGLPPPEGPDYTAPLPHSPYSPGDLRPFPSERLVRAGHSPNEHKRPRTSDAHEIGAGHREMAQKRLRGDSGAVRAD